MAMKQKGVLTEEDIYKMELTQEQELFRLERQYRIMERDRITMSQGGGSKLAKQARVLNILKKEQKELLKDLNVATSSTNKKKYKAVMKNLDGQLKEHDEFNRELKQGRTQLYEMNFHIKNIEKAVIEKRKTQITEFDEQQNVLHAQKNLEALENKLETATRRFCTILTDNRKMREEIYHLLDERARFNLLWGKLIDNLAKGKKFMLDLIEQATIAYDQREECCVKLQALRHRAQSDFVMHSQEMLLLQRQIDYDGELEKFLRVKGQRRLMLDLEQKREIKHNEVRLALEQQLRSYQEMLNEIEAFTGEREIRKIASNFVKTETENFGNFMYINNMNREMEGLSRELNDLREQIDWQVELRNKRGEGQAQKLKVLEDSLVVISKKVEMAEEELKEREKKLNALLVGIEQIFNICKCNNAPLLQLLGDNTSINYFNVLLYLEVLEQQINILLTFVFYKQKTAEKKKTKDNVIREDRPKPIIEPMDTFITSNPCPLCVEQDQVVDLVESVQFALNKQEITAKLFEILNSPEHTDVVHNVSACHLPKSREIIQKRYQ